MSEQPQDQGENPVDVIARYEDTIEQNRDIISHAIEENTASSDLTMDSDDVFYGLRMALRTELGSDEAAILSSGILNYLVSSDTDSAEVLREKGVGRVVVQFLTQLVLRYELEIRRLVYADTQGSRFWTNVTTDLVARASEDEPGFSHQVNIAFDEEVQIDAGIVSNLNLVEYLLDQQIRAVDFFEDDALKRMHPQRLSRLLETLKGLTQQVEKYHQANLTQQNGEDRQAEGSSSDQETQE